MADQSVPARQFNTGIYEILNTMNGKRYVGSAKDFSKRWSRHRSDLRCGKHHSPAMQRAWVKYSKDAFEFRVLLVCGEVNLLLYEQMLMDGLCPEYNVAPVAGSSRGRRTSEETKAKLALAITGKKRSNETKARMSESARKVVRHSPSSETRQRLSDSLRGRKRPRTPEHSRKIGLSRRKFTDAQIREMRALLLSGQTQASIALQMSCSAAFICTLASGKRHSGVI